LQANGFTRQNVYKKRKALQKQQTIENEILPRILNARKRHKKMGARVMHAHLKVEEMGINKFEKFVSNHGLSVINKKKRIVTTIGVYEKQDKNLINGLVLNNINQVIAGDITYLITSNYRYFIFTLKDMYSKRIVGIYGSTNMFSLNAIKVLQQVKNLRGDDLEGCIHHSDAGTQYKAKIYKNMLSKCGVKMSIAGDCLENGMAEQLNGVLKNDYLEDGIKNERDLNKKLKEIQWLINHERPVEALGYKTPVEFESSLGKNEKNFSIKLFDFEKAKIKRMRDFLQASDNKKVETIQPKKSSSFVKQTTA
jgi:putative transposase